ncbi:hypothetical protein MPTK1_3g07810 [Marchantia polymorpha subsp. ruderalis]|uniref:Gb protein n=2 Tax=Marchantia polymorpha TaxID=3197 RepID=A0AAF6AYH4_MARPO|nr:hypothetical protein MARPO_0006s0258 [Marchantia polymorpha]BBN04808.1 hypothetical protein Mp_3g07810 [Marchantia polymorpha subsp. ruderalis]|eukprot:PTQ48260.1 hypothetical protein MARPO_0006s0258 [Marchantia polymorpha]
MADRFAMESKNRANYAGAYHAPTMSPGIGSPRCPRCAAPLSKDLEASGWTIAPFMRESFAVVGTAVGGSTSAFYGFNTVMPPVHKHVRGPLWLQFLVGLPPVMLFSVACAGLAGGALPAFAQLAVSTYHATSASSHSAVSKLTMQVEQRQELPSFANSLAQAKESKESVKQRS